MFMKSSLFVSIKSLFRATAKRIPPFMPTFALRIKQRESMKILGVGRAPQFSPNSTERDAAILEAVKTRLEQHVGCEVCLIDEREFSAGKSAGFDAIFSMARSHEALQAEAEAERRGVFVCNSAVNRLRLNRRSLLALSRRSGIPVPDYRIADGPLDETPFPFPFWMKRDDRTTMQKTDVRLIRDDSRWREAMQAVREERLAHYVLERHVAGDLIKFYGVNGTDFFHHSYSGGPEGFSKFGMERANGQPQGFPFEARRVKLAADRLAAAAGIDVYGGDAVVCADGSFRLIDFNDWPSFSPCRDEAAEAIVQRMGKSLDINL